MIIELGQGNEYLYNTEKETRKYQLCLFLSSSNHAEHREGSLLDCSGFADIFCGSIYNSSVLQRTKCSSCRTGLNSHTSTCWFSFHFANMLLLTPKTGANLKPLKQMYRNLFSASPQLPPYVHLFIFPHLPHLYHYRMTPVAWLHQLTYKMLYGGRTNLSPSDPDWTCQQMEHVTWCSAFFHSSKTSLMTYQRKLRGDKWHWAVWKGDRNMADNCFMVFK